MTATAAATTGAVPTARGRDVINVRDLTKHFPIREGVLQRVTGQIRAVDGVSFDIPRGTTVGLVGESGCGKTTLGRCIAGLMAATSGGVYFGMDDASIARLDALRAVDPAARSHMMEITGRRTVPQIFIGDTHVGGHDDLVALDGRGGLMPLLGA